MNSTFYLFDPEEYYSREVEPLGEMATVADSDRPVGLSIQVNPDPDRIGNPYFKVYNTAVPKIKESRVARLHFLDSGMEYHQDKFMDWIPTKKEIKSIKDLLSQKHLVYNYTNWQVACFLWNQEYHLFMQKDIDDYMNGLLDEKLSIHPSYVPSTTVMPETWVYNPSKKKNKRK